MATLILLVGGCLWGKGLEACDSYGDPIAREECVYDNVKTVIADDAALDAALARIESETSRDLVLYRLAVDNPDRAQALCKRTRGAAMRDKCDKVLGRPHLSHGPTSGGDAGAPSPGAPTPGGDRGAATPAGEPGAETPGAPTPAGDHGAPTPGAPTPGAPTPLPTP